jgi:ATP-binding protein involved in chromosome partitioning
MSYFVMPGMSDEPGNRQYIFGREGGRKLADEYDIPYLGFIPLIQAIREGGDTGVPAMAGEDDGPKDAFLNFAGTTARSIAMRNANMSGAKTAQVVELQ